MEDQINKILKAYKAIEPSADFHARSRRIVLSSHIRPSPQKSFRKGFFEDLQFGAALLVASAFGFFILLTFSGTFRGNAVADTQTVNETELLTEARSLDANINLHEAKYFMDSAEEVAAALDRIGERTTQ